MSAQSTRPSLSLAALATAVVAAWLTATSAPEAKKIQYDFDFDEAVDFAGLKTWGWHPSGRGEVKLAISSTSDPAPLKAKADPVIVAAIERELPRRGLTKVDGTADVLVVYRLLGTVSSSSQDMGQFLGWNEWGVPPFRGSSQSLRVFPVGTLLVDLFAANGKDLVWRGIARAEVDLDKSPAERKERLESVIRDMLAKFPPKAKKK
jgi:hypothetical protein